MNLVERRCRWFSFSTIVCPTQNHPCYIPNLNLYNTVQINVWLYRRGNHNWTIQKKIGTQDEDKNTAKTQHSMWDHPANQHIYHIIDHPANQHIYHIIDHPANQHIYHIIVHPANQHIYHIIVHPLFGFHPLSVMYRWKVYSTRWLSLLWILGWTYLNQPCFSSLVRNPSIPSWTDKGLHIVHVFKIWQTIDYVK